MVAGTDSVAPGLLANEGTKPKSTWDLDPRRGGPRRLHLRFNLGVVRASPGLAGATGSFQGVTGAGVGFRRGWSGYQGLEIRHRLASLGQLPQDTITGPAFELVDGPGEGHSTAGGEVGR